MKDVACIAIRSTEEFSDTVERCVWSLSSQNSIPIKIVFSSGGVEGTHVLSVFEGVRADERVGAAIARIVIRDVGLYVVSDQSSVIDVREQSVFFRNTLVFVNVIDGVGRDGAIRSGKGRNWDNFGIAMFRRRRSYGTFKWHSTSVTLHVTSILWDTIGVVLARVSKNQVVNGTRAEGIGVQSGSVNSEINLWKGDFSSKSLVAKFIAFTVWLHIDLGWNSTTVDIVSSER